MKLMNTYYWFDLQLISCPPWKGKVRIHLSNMTSDWNNYNLEKKLNTFTVKVRSRVGEFYCGDSQIWSDWSESVNVGKGSSSVERRRRMRRKRIPFHSE
ncbi:interleukin-5 receptor subunit alpha-like [Callorhinchus milii]|uniref:interleukin-5 receptor subunit alpha-like n=1 Tax=Callorhinchus milii TaxID=7868 RepID=UPI001C3FA133|nr:interleukin-5 receptor subunit alpha-like [Callorhinchus milii]